MSQRSTLVIGLMVVFYLVLGFRAAWLMWRSGRSFWLWLLLSLLLTNIPAMTLLMRDQRRGYCPASLADDERDETDEGDHHLRRRRADKRSNRRHQ